MKVKITNLAKNPMQSGLAKNNKWQLSVMEEKPTRSINNLTGWTSSNDTKTQIELDFKSKEEAISYAKENNLEYVVSEAKPSTIKAKSYASNFIAPILE